MKTQSKKSKMKEENMKNKKLEFIQREKEPNQYQLRIDNIGDMNKILYPKFVLDKTITCKQRIILRITKKSETDQFYKLLYSGINTSYQIVIDFESNIIHIHGGPYSYHTDKKIEHDKDDLNAFLKEILEKLQSLNVKMM